MSKIRVLSDHIANQIAAGEVVERPASVAKELVENSIDSGANRIEVEIQAGGRRLLRVSDNGEGMTQDDAILAFERHATSKISSSEDLTRIGTLGFRGEALSSIGAVSRVELFTHAENQAAGSRVRLEGGKMRDVRAAARSRGTTVTVRDLFFNVPARRKFLRSEATETYHLTNLVTHYALAHPEISFSLSVNGRETLRAAPASSLRERAYQIFGSEFLENLLELDWGYQNVVRVSGYISAPRERRTSRDSQYLFVNGRFVRDRLVSRALSDGFRSVLPHGSYPAALLFLELPLDEVDVNVHPAKTEVRFRRAAAIADAVREGVRQALAGRGYLRSAEESTGTAEQNDAGPSRSQEKGCVAGGAELRAAHAVWSGGAEPSGTLGYQRFACVPDGSEAESSNSGHVVVAPSLSPSQDSDEALGCLKEVAGADVAVNFPLSGGGTFELPGNGLPLEDEDRNREEHLATPIEDLGYLADRNESAISRKHPLPSAAGYVSDASEKPLSSTIRPLGQLQDSFIIATDESGLLLIDQHVAHERILFDMFRRSEEERRPESQQLLIPELFDLTPAQATCFESIVTDLERYGFDLMRFSGRTVAIKAVPAGLPSSEARNVLREVLDAIDQEKRGAARANMRDTISASLACKAAIKINTPLSPEKMQWLIDRLLLTSSPTTCPHGRPVVLRLSLKDIVKGFHRSRVPN